MSEAMKSTLAVALLVGLLFVQVVQYLQSRKRFGKLDRMVGRSLSMSEDSARALRGVLPGVTKLIAGKVESSLRSLDEKSAQHGKALGPAESRRLPSFAQLVDVRVSSIPRRSNPRRVHTSRVGGPHRGKAPEGDLGARIWFVDHDHCLDPRQAGHVRHTAHRR